MRRAAGNQCVAVAVVLILLLLASTVVLLLAQFLQLHGLILLASVTVAWGVVSVVLILLLIVWLRTRIVGALLALAWCGWYLVGIVATPRTVSRVLPAATLLTALFLLVPALWLLSSHLLPPTASAGRRKALRCLLTFSTGMNYPYYRVVDRADSDEKLVETTSGNPYARSIPLPGGFAFPPVGPGLVLTSCDHAVVISDGLEFKGAQGPGVVFTGWCDRPIQAIDLRPQLRVVRVDSLTEDGIQVSCQVFVFFQIETGEAKPSLGASFPYRKSAVFRAFHAQRMEHREGNLERGSWDELPGMAAQRVVQSIIGKHAFDELCSTYEIVEADEEPRSLIATTVKEQLKRELAPLGIRVIGAGIGNLLPADEAVLRQRIESWQAEWKRRTMRTEAEGQAKRLQMVERARAQARKSMILSLGKRIGKMGMARPAATAETVMGWFLDMLEDLNPQVRRFLPQNTLKTMDRARDRIEEVPH